MDAFSMYDAWLASPYTDQVEGPECDDCGAWMQFDVDADEDGRYTVTWCEECGNE